MSKSVRVVGTAAPGSTFLPFPAWGPWVGVPAEFRRVCAVNGCGRDGRPQICPFDGRYHHHGCIHYDRAANYPEGVEYREGWGWVCDFHYGAICAAAGKLEYVK